ncbi:hypothetical protein Tsubulata_007508 [Turnera subulata]|uniref:Uncharacterized protein n=1 Tax=Turnera subulata TaxID=218843 RepID=A0A9Q0JGW7_9ROSI|nr:hypothetical protein Tsubulata_007508 [Turnera subulata]
MEELKRLERVEKMIRLMEYSSSSSSSSGFVVSPSTIPNHHSVRFLANLLLLLVEPCGDLDLNQKCSLLTEYLPKIPNSFLEQASSLLFDSQVPIQVPTERTVEPQSLAGKNRGLLQEDLQRLTMVGFHAMQRANSTLEDFCRSYFMFHGLDINSPQSLFTYLPVLSFTESYIYQMDSFNEEMIDMSTNGIIDLNRGFEVETNESWIGKFMAVFKIDPFRPLVALLEYHNLLTYRITEEFRYGEEYWTLERKLCRALIKKKKVGKSCTVDVFVNLDESSSDFSSGFYYIH